VSLVRLGVQTPTVPERQECLMSDESVAARIERLVAEEHELLQQEQRDRSDDESLEQDHERLDNVRVELDRCWDLLRQRRALRDAGGDPDHAVARDADVVEKYWQ
jgi:hypothetical protein